MKLTFYMKSGNVIKVSGIDEYEIENSGNEIVSLKLKYSTGIMHWLLSSNRLLVKTVALDQIEAITKDN